ncbi:MAG TPA: AAA family ATPase [Terracidiphilus sp.]|jgi:NadR type nicotinamide-nucleotide adenylyltransferase
MTRGLVIGKFYPPHRGHKFLIETALRSVDHLDVLICVLPSQTISGDLRERWLKEIHPEANVMQVEDIGHDDDSEVWAEYTKTILGQAPDLVFTSEGYGDAYARFLGCRHILVDRDRILVPTSGTQIRLDPFAYWDFLEPCVRAHFVKRVCVVGAESTGTTTLARDLAEHYDTVWVPEYGREYCEKLAAGGVDLWSYGWNSAEFTLIARTQVELERNMAREANRLMICDTDAFATGIWHQRYVGSRSTEVDAIAASDPPCLYLLTDCDIPFVQDGLRDGENIRAWMTRRFEEELKQREVPWVKVSGTGAQRLETAIQAIESVLPRLGIGIVSGKSS